MLTASNPLLKCLIVDDHAAMRQMIRRILRDTPATFIECSDGEEAVARYAKELPDWVFMDIRMKSVDGISALRRIKSEHPTARIVMVTHHNDDALRQAATQAGAHAYVLKENLLLVRELVLASAQPESGPVKIEQT